MTNLINDYILNRFNLEIKSIKKVIRYNIISLILDLYLIIVYLYNSVNLINSNKIWTLSLLINIVCFIVWSVLLYISIIKFKKNKIKFKNKVKEYYELLKIIDYPKYIKMQRIKKLKKLKNKI